MTSKAGIVLNGRQVGVGYINKAVLNGFDTIVWFEIKSPNVHNQSNQLFKNRRSKMQEKYQEKYSYRGHSFTIGLLVGSGFFGLIIGDGVVITTDNSGRPFDGQLEDVVKHAEMLIDTIIANTIRCTDSV